MNFVVMSAALSSMNTNVYLCSRMLFSLSRGGYAPRAARAASSERARPVAAILVSGACILVAAAVSKFTPYAYNYLFGVALFAAIIVWMLILVSHLSFRRQLQAAPTCRCACRSFPGCSMPGCHAGGGAREHGTGPDLDVSWVYGVPWVALISAAPTSYGRRAAPALVASALP